MTDYATQSEFARDCGKTRGAISKGIRAGLIESDSLGIDRDHPLNQKYRASINVKTGGPPKKDIEILEEVNFNPLQNNYEITRLNKAKADKEVLAYATKLGAVVEIETLTQKFNRFMDFVVSDLIAMPDDIADMLWSKASGSEHPEASIRADLKDRVASIIENAQAAAGEVVPEVDERKYTITDIKSKSKAKSAESAPSPENA